MIDLLRGRVKREIVHESNIWATFYCIFNDDNTEHCLNSYYNCGMDRMNEDEIRQRNLDWIKEIRRKGISDREIVELMPEAKDYITAYQMTRR